MRYLDPKNIDKLSSIIEKLYEKNRYVTLRALLVNYYPKDIEQSMRRMDSVLIASILKVASPSSLVDIFQHLSLEKQMDVLFYLREYEIKFLFENLADDDRTILLRELDEDFKDKILLLISEKERKVAQNLLAYEEESAGSIAVSHYAYTYESFTVQESIDLLRERSMKIENISTIFVLNQDDQLMGTVALEQLVFSQAFTTIKDLMSYEYIAISDIEDQEMAVELIEKYDLTILPVINKDEKLVGVITHDDIVDILIRQGTEDFQRFAGVSTTSAAQDDYLSQGIWFQAKRRLTWTVIPVFMEIITGMIILHGQDIFKTFFVLATYMPMITSAGGTIGSQSTSIVIRSLALKEIQVKDFFRVIRKEFLVSFIMAVSVSCMIALKVWLLPHYHYGNISFYLIMLTISLSMGAQLISSAVIGSLTPFIAVVLRIDAALMSAPVVSSLVDITGMLIYFTIAKLILF